MPLEEVVDQLIAFAPPDHLPVLSLYLNAQTDDHGRHNFRAFARKELTDRVRSYELGTAERKSIDADLERINRFLGQEIRSSTKGIAIFACSSANNFFETVQLEAPIEESRLFIYDHPHLYPLARLLNQYQRYAVVLADTNAAKIFVLALGQAVKRKELQNVKTKRIQVGGWSQMRYQRHIENYHLHHAKEVVRALARLVRDEKIEHVILSGDEATIIPLLREQLSKEISDRVIDVLSLGIDSSERELLDETLKAYRRHDSLSHLEKVEHLLNEYRADGLAVAGVPQSLAALSNGQVEELLMTASSATLQFDKAEVVKVLVAYGKNGDEIRKIDQDTIADELVRRATQLSSARVTFIEDDSVLKTIGGVGALLRYRVSTENAAPYEQGRAVSTAEAMLRLH